MSKEIINQTAHLIARDFGLEIDEETLTEQALFDLVANEVAYMIEHRIDFLMSLLYRLDVLEHKINFALSPHSVEAPNIALTRLILDRQKERINTKKIYKQDKVDDLEGLEF